MIISYMVKEKFLRTVRKSGTSLSVNIPPEIIRLLRVKEGNIVRISLEKVREDG